MATIFNIINRCVQTRSLVLKLAHRQSSWPILLNERCISSTLIHWKRRKTAEERKHKHSIEYSPKKKNKIELSGIVDIWRNMTVADLAHQSGREIEEIQEVMLYVKGIEDFDEDAKLEDPQIIKEIVNKCGYKSKIIAAPESVKDEEDMKDKDIFPRPPPELANLKERPPVVTVMGHVDHGKTTLLDSLRGASVAESEAGGITQHIGAFTVELYNNEKVTFLDTPGHAAFSAMRARGAHLTDIIVLVVAADDGVMEQTKEVINLSKTENVPVIVAINKMDKPQSDSNRVKRELASYGIALEGFGGDTISVNVSALQGTNLLELTEAVSTQATLMGLRAEYVGPVEGVVVESKVDPRRGKLSTAIVTRGTLRKGTILVSGLAIAKVRGLFDHTGQPLKEASPGMPVEVLGWRDLPMAGDVILEVDSEKHAHSVIRFRSHQAQKQKAMSDLEVIQLKQMSHDEEYRKQREARRMSGYFKPRNKGFRPKESAPEDTTPRVNVIIKGDMHGSVEAILDVLDTYYNNDECRLDIVHYGVGDVHNHDIELAHMFKAVIYAFSVKVDTKVPKDVQIYETNIIYRLVDHLKTEINSKLPLREVEEIVGEANILQLFEISEARKKAYVLGCRCVKGLLKKANKYKLVRGADVIAVDLELSSMRHLKNEVDSIKKDVECGLKLTDQNIEVKPGDTLVCYKMNMVSKETEWDPGF